MKREKKIREKRKGEVRKERGKEVRIMNREVEAWQGEGQGIE